LGILKEQIRRDLEIKEENNEEVIWQSADMYQQ
jgi:hypothetical protein